MKHFFNKQLTTQHNTNSLNIVDHVWSAISNWPTQMRSLYMPSDYFVDANKFIYEKQYHKRGDNFNSYVNRQIDNLETFFNTLKISILADDWWCNINVVNYNSVKEYSYCLYIK